MTNFVTKEPGLIFLEENKTINFLKFPGSGQISSTNSCLPLDIISRILPYLHVQDIHCLLLTHKDSFKLLKETKVLNQLFADPKINHLKLASLVGPVLSSITHMNLDQSQMKEEEIIGLATRCSKLTHLSLAYTKVTGKGVSAIAESCPDLSHLALSGCKGITDQAIAVLANKCRHLTSLDLTDCQNITDKALIALAKDCPKLKDLNLSWCLKVRDRGIVALTEGCQELTSLNLDMTQATGSAIVSLAQNCKKLTIIDLRCKGITNDVINTIVKSCPHLTSLTLEMNDNISDETLMAVATNCPSLLLCIK